MAIKMITEDLNVHNWLSIRYNLLLLLTGQVEVSSFVWKVCQEF